MQYNFIHASDVHFEPGGLEKRPAFRPFLEDLRQIIPTLAGQTFFLLSGDVAQSGGQSDYEALLSELDPVLCDVGVPKNRRICVPGNHDVSRKVVEDSAVDHEGVIALKLSEASFNQYVQNPSKVYRDKFHHYLHFQSQFCDFGISLDSIAGEGHSLDENVGIYCCNSAFLSSDQLVSSVRVPALDAPQNEAE